MLSTSGVGCAGVITSPVSLMNRNRKCLKKTVFNMSNETRKEIGLDSESSHPLFQRGQMLRARDGIQFAVIETPRQRNGMVYHFRSYGLDDDHMIHELSKDEMEDGRFISENASDQSPNRVD